MTVCHLQQGRGARVSLGVTNYLVMQWATRCIFRGALTTAAPWGCDCVLAEKQEKSTRFPFLLIWIPRSSKLPLCFSFSSFSPTLPHSWLTSHLEDLQNILPACTFSSPTLCSAELGKSPAGELRPLAGIVRAARLQPCWEASAFAYSCLLKDPQICLSRAPYLCASPPDAVSLAHRSCSDPAAFRHCVTLPEIFQIGKRAASSTSTISSSHPQSSPGSEQPLEQKASRKAFSLKAEHSEVSGTTTLWNWQIYALWF